ncbi:MAG: LptF/LptG family permease, partial [Planctomycetes bacterium]|nr:LptF/LptG family permease [Planctomycetota bacterium]
EGSFGRFSLPPLDFAPPGRPKIRPSMRNLAALTAMMGRKDKAYPDYKIETELHKRIADSFSPLVFVFLSLPVAILFRQQNRMVAFLIAILLALFIYYPVSILGETFANDGYLDPVLSIWPGNIALAFLGFVCILKVMRR